MEGGKDPLVDNKNLYNVELNFIKIFGWITKIVFILYIIGFFKSKPIRIIEINFIVKIAIALFLIYRFNSYRHKKVIFTELDRKVVYSAGMYILLISFADILDVYVSEIRDFLYPFFEKIYSLF
jgi:hypothetical protein